MDNAELLKLLRDEYALHRLLDAPWLCTTPSCPYKDQPMVKTCGCFHEAQEAHRQKVRLAFAQQE